MRTEVDAHPLNLGLGKFLLCVRQRFFFGLAAHGAESLADRGKSVGRPGLGRLALSHEADVVAFTMARTACLAWSGPCAPCSRVFT